MADETPAAPAAPVITTAAATAAATSTAAAPWHDGIDAALLGHAQNKGWKYDNPKDAFAAAVNAHREAERFIGAPANELLRMPKANAAETDVKAFYSRLGVPAEPKDYDLSAVKFSDGTELDANFTDTIRASLYRAHVAKDRAGDVVKDIVKFMESSDASDSAETAAKIAAERDALKNSWGRNAEANMFVARQALNRLAGAAGMTADQAGKAWDALSTVGGIGAAAALEMLRVAGSTMGEDRFVAGNNPQGGHTPMTREAAAAEINSLKQDAAFRERLLKGSADDRRRWDALHKIAYGQAA